jgi:hypothetical protein
VEAHQQLILILNDAMATASEVILNKNGNSSKIQVQSKKRHLVQFKQKCLNVA